MLALVPGGFETLQTLAQKKAQRVVAIYLLMSSRSSHLFLLLTCHLPFHTSAHQDRALHHGALTLGRARGSTTVLIY